jgi:hypothetical protein
MLQWLADHREELPGDAPSVAPELRLTAGKLHAGGIPVSDRALRVGGVDRRRQHIEHWSPVIAGRKRTERIIKNLFGIRLHFPARNNLC